MIPTFGGSVNHCPEIINEYLLLAHIRPRVYCIGGKLVPGGAEKCDRVSLPRKVPMGLSRVGCAWVMFVPTRHARAETYAALFFAARCIRSDQYITGTELVVDGGLTVSRVQGA